MKRARVAVMLLVSCVLLSACGLLDYFTFYGREDADARTEDIVEALNNHDAAALKDMFSSYALQNAPEIDEGIQYLLSLFPDGGVTWERQGGFHTSKHLRYGKKTVLLFGNYKLSADGKDFDLYFADFVVNQVENPDNVGLYALGVTPKFEDGDPGADVGFGYWAHGINLQTEDGEFAYPGVYVPRDGLVYPVDQADARMEQIAAALNAHDAVALKAMFSEPALAEATGFDPKLATLLSMFPDGGVTWEQTDVYTIDPEDFRKSKVVQAYYTLTAGGNDYYASFIDFLFYTENPDRVGLASLAVTPWHERGADPDPDPGYTAWGETWYFGDEGSVGIYVPIGDRQRGTPSPS